MTRLVVLLCGPPGAGKTTLAHQSGLRVYDRDDYPDERTFTRALDALRAQVDARAVVIRAAATSSARRRVKAQAGVTHAYLVGIGTPRHTLERRVRQRARLDNLAASIAGVASWLAAYDRDDRCPDWPGSWEAVLHTPATAPPAPRDTRAADAAKAHLNATRYGPAHKAARARWAQIVAQGRTPCARCGKLIPGGRIDHKAWRETWHLGHPDDRPGGIAPEHASCNIDASNRSSKRVRHAPPQPTHRKVSSW